MNKILFRNLSLAFGWNKSRIECFYQIIISLITNCAVSTKGLACGISGKALFASKVQRVYRFLREHIIDYDVVASFILSLFTSVDYTIAIDRTKSIKSAGFDIEKSHITDPERFSKLLAICAIASSLIIKNGVIKDRKKPIILKKHKTGDWALFSLFTYGLDQFKHTIIHASPKTLSLLFKTLFISRDISSIFPIPEKL